MKWKNLPPETRRAYVYQDMTAAAKEAAKEIHEKLRIANKRDLLLKHAIGTRANEGVRNIGTYGQDFVDELSFVLGFSEDMRALLE